MTTPLIRFLLIVLDSYWFLEANVPKKVAPKAVAARAIAQATAKIQGVVSGEDLVYEIVERLDKDTRVEALALFYLGRGDADDWNGAWETSKCASAVTLPIKCVQAWACADNIRKGIRIRSEGGVWSGCSDATPPKNGGAP